VKESRPPTDALAIEPNRKVILSVAVFDAISKEPLETEFDEGVTYIHGYGQLVPGLERQLSGLKSKEKKQITVPVEEAFGERDEELMFVLPYEELGEEYKPGDLDVGDALVLEDDEGDDALFHVLEVRQDGLALDGNHPLSGFSLRFDIEVTSVTEASDEEIEEAARAYSEAEESVLGTLEERSQLKGLATLGTSRKEDWSKN
jgi:FKBP-type peptidyl-prolyl cis-trans isomerase SlyD